LFVSHAAEHSSALVRDLGLDAAERRYVQDHQSGYDLEPIGDSQTKVTVFNSFAGHGFGKVIVGFARRAAAKDADAFAQRIKAAVEAN
jgi:hypothetical protein